MPTHQRVLLEDDEPLARLWQKAALKKGIPFRYFTSPEIFLQSLEAFAPDTEFYLDTEFPKSAFKIVQIIEALGNAGFREIYISTGHRPETLKDLRGHKGIRGKEPPWLK